MVRELGVGGVEEEGGQVGGRAGTRKEGGREGEQDAVDPVAAFLDGTVPLGVSHHHQQSKVRRGGRREGRLQRGARRRSAPVCN